MRTTTLLKLIGSAGLIPFFVAGTLYGQTNESSKLPRRAFYKCDVVNAKRECKYGFMDDMGCEVIAARFDNARDFSEGRALVDERGHTEYIDSTGTPVISSPEFEYTEDFSDGVALARVEGDYAYIDKQGEIVIRAQYEAAQSFSEGLAAVKVNDKWGFIDKTGKIVIQPQYDQAGRFSDGLAMVQNENNRPPSGYIDKSGNLIIKNKDANYSFSEGLVPIAVRRFGFSWWLKWGYVDKSGKFVIKPTFDEAGPFVNGEARVAKGCGPARLNEMSACKWFYIDKTGKVLRQQTNLVNLQPIPKLNCKR